MTNLRSYSLALFGEIDKEVMKADSADTPANTAILAMTEKLLPNSAALGEHGWYGELEEFLNLPKVRNMQSTRSRFTFPSFDDAKKGLARQPSEDRDLPSAEPQDDDYHPALARATYAVVVLEKIRRIKNAYRDPDTPELDEDFQLMSLLPGLVNPWLKGGKQIVGQAEPGFFTAQEKADALAAVIDEINDQETWLVKAGEAVDPQFAQCAKPCFGTLEDSGGEYCSTLYTRCEDDELTVDDIKKIVHPLNWHICCPSFFQAMTAQLPGKYTQEGWSRIVEEISAEPDEYCLNTALIFWMQDRDGGIVINYDLDPDRQHDSGYVEIDNGYIWVTPTSTVPGSKGVRIETSKQERVNGLSPTATAALGCLLGWSDNGKEMLAGTARKLMKGELPAGTVLTPWKTSVDPPAAGEPIDTGKPTSIPTLQSKLPLNFGDTVDDSRKLLNSLIRRVTRDLGEAGQRWMDGVVRSDVEAVTAQMGTDLKEWSLEVYDTAERNVKPPKGGAN